MKIWRSFFLVAGAFNVLGGLGGFFTFEAQFRLQELEPPTYPFAFQLLFIAVVILGVGYLMVAYDPVRNRNLVWIGLLTKIAGFAMTCWAIADGQLPPSAWWQPVVNDLIWAIGFAGFLLATRRE
ncbi:MAG: hypothetical protein GY856_15820 [bacterium]|nr:hypothetical protein [bacterium]